MVAPAKKLVAPTRAEGFDRLFSVRTHNDGTFSVQTLD